MRIKLDWTNFKAQVTVGYLPYRYFDIDGTYFIYAVDGSFEYETAIIKDEGADQVDFDTNFKAAAFLTFSQFDIDGAAIVRPKAAKKGWSFWALPPEITTSKINGDLFCKDVNGVDVPGVVCKIYNSNNEEITTAGILNANLATCVQTVLDIENPFDTELIGGELRIHSNPSQDLRVWIVGAPDIPVIYGGSKEFASGINLKFLAPDNSFDVDGRVTKFITWNNVTHSGKIRIVFKHGAGLTVNLQCVIHLYRL